MKTTKTGATCDKCGMPMIVEHLKYGDKACPGTFTACFHWVCITCGIGPKV